MRHSTDCKFRIKLPPMLIVLLGFLAMMLIGAFLLALPISNTDGQWQSFTDSLFTAASAVCVTGLTVKPTAVSFGTFGQVVIMLLIQIGGLGFMTITTLIFIMIRKRITLKDRIAIQEALGQDRIKGVVRLICNIAIMTAVIETAGAILLTPFFCVKNGAIGVWQAVFTSISAFCNAGFDIFGTAQNPYSSLTEYSDNVGVVIIIGALIVLGGLGFTVIHDILDKKFRFRKFTLHTKIVIIVTAALLIFGTLFFLCSEFDSTAYEGMNGGQKLLNSIFQSVTCRTAGFNAIEQTSMSNPGKIFTCILMFIGASPGSTGGGIKTTTFAVIILMAFSGLCGKEEIVINKRTIKTKIGYRAVAIATVATALILISLLIISATDGNVPTEYLLFDLISAFGTVGLSTGICPTLTTFAKIIFVLVMFIGRLGPLSIGLIFAKHVTANIKYPSASIMIG